MTQKFKYNPITDEMDLVGEGTDIMPVSDAEIEALFNKSNQ